MGNERDVDKGLLFERSNFLGSLLVRFLTKGLQGAMR